MSLAGPVIKVLQRPAATFGLPVVHIVVSAVWSTSSSNSTGTGTALAGTPVPSATFEVQLPGSSLWTPVCTDTAGNCNGTCTGVSCPVLYTLPSILSAQYTLSLRAVLSGATGDATTVSWSFVRCDATQFAIVNDTDGGIQCSQCTTWKLGLCRSCVVCVVPVADKCYRCLLIGFAGPAGGNCAVADLTQQQDIVAQLGYWAPSDSDGSVFYKCPIPQACLPGVNGSRSQCAPGYGSIACRSVHDLTALHTWRYSLTKRRSVVQ